MYFNGKSLIDQSLKERKDQLDKIFLNKQYSKYIEKIQGNVLNLNQENFSYKLEQLLNEAYWKGLEGLMLKSMDLDKTFYDTQGRTQWAKAKNGLLQNSALDNLDLVPIGGYWGKGKRSKYIGAYLMSSFNPETRKYEAICKLGTGFSDEFLKEKTQYFKNFVDNEQSEDYNICPQLKPDFWLTEKKVWEVQFDSFSLSSTYKIGKFDNIPDNTFNKGISLRFPRFIQERQDKNTDQATNTQQIIEMYISQNTKY